MDVLGRALRSWVRVLKLRHPDIPEPIDVVWGAPRSDYSEGFGLAKIAQLHPEVLPNLPERLAKMDVCK